MSATGPISDRVDVVQAQIEDTISSITERRSVIDQAKGMLMFVLGIDAQAAFDVLREQSQQHNVKLRLIAEQIVGDLVELSKSKPTLNRRAYGILFTAHERLADVAERERNGHCQTGVSMKDLQPQSRA